MSQNIAALKGRRTRALKLKARSEGKIDELTGHVRPFVLDWFREDIARAEATIAACDAALQGR